MVPELARMRKSLKDLWDHSNNTSHSSRWSTTCHLNICKLLKFKFYWIGKFLYVEEGLTRHFLFTKFFKKSKSLEKCATVWRNIYIFPFRRTSSGWVRVFSGMPDIPTTLRDMFCKAYVRCRTSHTCHKTTFLTRTRFQKARLFWNFLFFLIINLQCNKCVRPAPVQERGPQTDVSLIIFETQETFALIYWQKTLKENITNNFLGKNFF